jgi:ketosteroid isomerase-like protein
MTHATLTLAAFALAIAGCAHQNGSRPTLAEDIAAINAYNAKSLAGLNAGDYEAVNALLAEDYVVMIPNRPPTVGKERIAAGNKTFMQQFRNVETWTPEETVVDGDLAFQRGVYDLTFIPVKGGDSRRIYGNYLHIYQRQKDGQWLLTRAMTTSFPPPQ